MRSDTDGFSYKNDSIFTVCEQKGWHWFGGDPINYNPSELPRSQDAQGIWKETTGLYGITRDALAWTNRRIGLDPILYQVENDEAVDIDTEFDFFVANAISNPRSFPSAGCGIRPPHPVEG